MTDTRQGADTIELTARTFVNGSISIDGQPHPGGILSITYRFDIDHSLPELTIEYDDRTITYEANRVHIDHDFRE